MLGFLFRTVLFALGALLAASFLGGLGRLFGGASRKGSGGGAQAPEGNRRFGIAEKDVVDVPYQEVDRD